MRRDLRRLGFRIVLILDVTVAVVAAAFLLAVYLAPGPMSQLRDTRLQTLLLEYPDVYAVGVHSTATWNVLIVVGVVVLIGNLLWLVYGGSPPSPPSHLQSQTTSGVIKVARDAVETSLRAAGESVEGVSRLRVSIEPSGGVRRVAMRASFHCLEEADVGLIGGRLRAVLRRKFAELVRLPDGQRLDVALEFLGFAGRPPRQKAAPEEPKVEPKDDDSFRGPEYPIGDDGWKDA
ncbi:MAG: hypothetical protein AAF196_18355 [Planctomycetota bacterium]